jgi:hypothetical protein
MRLLIFCVLALFLPAALVRAADAPAKARTADEIKKKLAEITAPPDKEPEGMAGEREGALRRLKAYRYLAGVPYDDLALDDDYNAACEAAAKLCAKLGRIDHKPPNAGLPEDEYKLAVKGAGQSNLAEGFRPLAKAVDAWMFDTDEASIRMLGHRRWCLNPTMKKTGFGRSGTFTAMYSIDRNRRDVPDFDFICWPPRGPAPVEYFTRGSAWSVTLHPRKYNPPGEGVTAKVYAADAKGNKTGDALKLDYNGVNTDGFAIPNCVIFRPEKFTAEPGQRYVVEIEGLTRGRDKKAVTVQYTVEFISAK